MIPWPWLIGPGIALVLVGLLSGAVLNLVPLFRKVRVKAREFDIQQIELPLHPWTLRELRRYDSVGDKTVIVHHLVGLIADVRSKIITLTFKGAMVSFLLALWVLGATLAAQQPSQPWSLFFAMVIDQIRRFYIVPIGVCALMIEALLFGLWAWEQAAKFRGVLDE